MTQRIITDPKAMIQFANQLQSFNKDLADKSKKLNAQFKELGQEWKDQDYQKFTNEFATLMKHINTYLKDAEAHPRLITKKATVYAEGGRLPV